MELISSPFGEDGRFTADEVKLIYRLIVDKLYQLREKVGDDITYVTFPELYAMKCMAEGELKARGEWEG